MRNDGIRTSHNKPFFIALGLHNVGNCTVVSYCGMSNTLTLMKTSNLSVLNSTYSSCIVLLVCHRKLIKARKARFHLFGGTLSDLKYCHMAT